MLETLRLTLEPHKIRCFYPILQKGVWLEGEVGCSVKAFLCDQMGISPEYVNQRIQTLFLNGQPVDDADRAVVHDRATLALSAAMPGFAGATLRKGGFYAKMRSSITYREEARTCGKGRGRILLKLFNHIVRELGPGLLKRGVWVGKEELEAFLGKQASDFWEACGEVRVDNESVDCREILVRNWPEEVSLEVHPAA